MHIIVNGNKETYGVGFGALSYERAVELAGYSPSRNMTVVVKVPGKEGRSLLRGQTMAIYHGTQVEVADTSNG